MASKCSSRIMIRATISSLKSSFNKSASSSSSLVNRSIPTSFPKSTNATTSFLRRFSLSRAPSELGAVQSMLPLHSTVATARMTSCLSSTSRSCRALSQDGSFNSTVKVYPEPVKYIIMHMSFQKLERIILPFYKGWVSQFQGDFNR